MTLHYNPLHITSEYERNYPAEVLAGLTHGQGRPPEYALPELENIRVEKVATRVADDAHALMHIWHKAGVGICRVTVPAMTSGFSEVPLPVLQSELIRRVASKLDYGGRVVLVHEIDIIVGSSIYVEQGRTETVHRLAREILEALHNKAATGEKLPEQFMAQRLQAYIKELTQYREAKEDVGIVRPMLSNLYLSVWREVQALSREVLGPKPHCIWHHGDAAMNVRIIETPTTFSQRWHLHWQGWRNLRSLNRKPISCCA